MGWENIWLNRDLLLMGFGNTIMLTILAILLSTALGYVVALLRLPNNTILNVIVNVYTEVFRGSPLIIQILFIYFGAAYLNIQGVTVFGAALLAISLFQGAYVSEIFRSGFDSVAVGQKEATKVLGLSSYQSFVSVVQPLSMRIVVVPLFGQYITLVKNTSLASVIGFADLIRQGQGIVDRFHNPFEVFFVVAVFYFMLSYPLSLIATYLEKRQKR